MQVILLEKIINLGDLGDVVNVRNGYARNYLIPQRKARRATPTALAEFEARRSELEKIQAERLAAAEAVGAKLNGANIVISQKAGVDGRLFGSVGSRDIIRALDAEGFADIEKSQVQLDHGVFKAIGEYPVVISLHPDVSAEITVEVRGDVA